MERADHFGDQPASLYAGTMANSELVWDPISCLYYRAGPWDASLSTIVVAHNSLGELRRSLPPLLAQLSDEDELIIVDNASSDGIAGGLEELAPRARLIAVEHNVGFAGGANRGVAAANGELIVLLNPDTVVQPGLADAICAPWGGPWAAWMDLVCSRVGNGSTRAEEYCTSRASAGQARPGTTRHGTGADHRGRLPVRRLPCDPTDPVGAARGLPGAFLHVLRRRRFIAAVAVIGENWQLRETRSSSTATSSPKVRANGACSAQPLGNHDPNLSRAAVGCSGTRLDRDRGRGVGGGGPRRMGPDEAFGDS